jgi:hypothetical protein
MKFFQEREDDLVVVASFTGGSEAHVLRLLLEANGVQAAVTGEETNATLGFGSGTDPNVFGVRVLVKRMDVEEARLIMQVPAASDVLIPAWICGCGAEVDEGFAVCWSCGKSWED